MMNRASIAPLLCCIVAAATVQAQSPESDKPYYDIGGFHRAVTTDSEQAQTWFNRGLAMCYGFNHEEAVRCFERAVAADPSLAMGYWGIAYAWGPNINNMEIEPHQIARADFAVQLAKLHSEDAADVERALIDALAKRYAAPAPEDRDPLNKAYADAMREVHGKHKDNALVVALFAESLMNLQPWRHWSADGKRGPHTQEIVDVLEEGLKRWPDHPALCHFYIHTMEASPAPEKALPAANRLRNAMPDMGHLVHMPSHIDVLLGDYRRTIEANEKAIAADNKFLEREGANNFYTLYRIHNYHFLVYGAMFDGQSELALRAARAIPKQAPEEMIKAQSDFLDAFIPTPLHVLVRFGRWDDILVEPEAPEYLPVTRAMRHYARALAYSATERIDEAKEEQKLFIAARKKVPETSFLFQNSSQSILNVAEAMIAGEIAYRERRFDDAFGHLREAVRRDDALNYDEPWGWMQPARHALGALLLEQGKYQESEEVYRADLKRHPDNPWAIHGLAESLAMQGKTEPSKRWMAKFIDATKRADVEIDRSCFCRLK